MRVHPIWWVGVIVYLAYNAVIYASWYGFDADYANLVASDKIFQSVVLPLAFGAVFVALAVTWLGWWRPALTEIPRGGPGWTIWVLALIMLGFIIVNLNGSHWSNISGGHLALLVAAGILVGFNEEAVTRGALIVGLRGSTKSEVSVWFWSSFLFGIMHLPNSFFGSPLAAGVMQTIFAFMAGGGFYLLRRVGGTILIPMVMHGAWDFATFSREASGAEIPSSAYAFQFGTYFVSIALVILVLRYGQQSKAA